MPDAVLRMEPARSRSEYELTCSAVASRRVGGKCRDISGYMIRLYLRICDELSQHAETAISDFTDPNRRLSRVVSTGGSRCGPGRKLAGPRLYGHQAVGLRTVGKHAGAARCDVQGNGTSQCVFSAVDPKVIPGARGGACRRICERMRSRHPSPPRKGPGRRADPRSGG